MRLHHVQVAIPVGAEDQARTFWVDVLGFEEVEKPPELAARGGVWFRLGAAEVHCGVEEPFVPARKAHPAFLVDDLDVYEQRLKAAGRELSRDGLLPGHLRFYTTDPFGNRLEIVTPR